MIIDKDHREGSSLNPSQQDPLVNLFQHSPTLANAYLLRMALTAIFEGSPDRVTAQTRLHRCGELVKAAGITCFDKFLTTLQHWQEGILSYFNSRHITGHEDRVCRLIRHSVRSISSKAGSLPAHADALKVAKAGS